MVETQNIQRCAAAYIRVSTEEQAELSPETQLEEIRKYANRQGIVLLEDQIYVDAGISGKKADKRPRFMEMIACAKGANCPFSVILLWKFSRFARNQEESIFYKSILRSKCGVDVVSITEPLIAGPFGSLIERIIEWMDEFYSIRLSQEVKRSMYANAKKGKLQSAPAFGYRVQNGALTPQPEEACTVQLIFRRFLSGEGLYQIARELNSMGVRTHRGNPFESRTVEYIIRNPVYIGKLRWNPTGKTRRDFFNEHLIVADSTHMPLIDLDTWNSAQRILDRQKSNHPYGAKPAATKKAWLSGLVRCASCGTTLVFSKPHYYLCNNFAKGRCTTSQHIPAKMLEAAITEVLEADSLPADPIHCRVFPNAEEVTQQLTQLSAKLRAQKVKQKRLQDAYLAGVIELDSFAVEKAAIENTIQETQQEIETIRSQSGQLDWTNTIQSASRNALWILKSQDTTIAEKNAAAEAVIERCELNREAGILKIYYWIKL